MSYRTAMTEVKNSGSPNTGDLPKKTPPTLGKKTALALYWNFIGRMGMMGGRFIESIVMVWLLGTTGFGEYKSAYNLMAIILPFTVLGLEAGISRFLPEIESKGKDSRPILIKLFSFRLVICLVAAAAIGIFAKPLALSQLHDVNLWPMVIIAAVIVVIHGVRNMEFRVLVARFRQKFLNGLQVGEIFLTLILATILVGVFDLGGAGALLAIVISGVIAVLISGIKIGSSQPKTDSQVKEKTVTVPRMIAFSATFYTYNLIATIMSKQLGIFLLPRFHSDIAQISYYDVSWVIAFFVVSISGKALVEGITLTIVSQAKETGDTDRLRKIYLLLTEYMYILTFPAVAGVYALGGDMLHLFYGGKMEGALVPLLVAMPFMAFHKMGGLTANFLAALDKEKHLVAGRIVTGVIVIVLDILLIPKYGALGVIFATSAAISLAVFYELILVHIFLRPSYPWLYFLKMLVIGIAVWLGASGTILILPFESIMLRLPIATGVGVAAFAIGLWLLKPVSIENLNLAASLKLPARKWMLKLLTPKKR